MELNDIRRLSRCIAPSAVGLTTWVRGDDIVASGGVVQSWPSRVGLSLSVVTGASQPTLTTVNGRAGATFNGSQFLLWSGAHPAGPRTIFVACKLDVLPLASDFKCLGEFKTTTSDWFTLVWLGPGLFASYGVTAFFAGAATGSVKNNDTLTTNVSVLGITYTGGVANNPASYTYARNGTAGTLAAGGAFGVSPVSNKNSLGARVDAVNGTTQGMIGTVFEVLEYSGVPTPAQITQTTHYLLGRY